MFGFDPAHGQPTFDEWLQRIHPEDRAASAGALDCGIREQVQIEAEFRVVVPQGPLKYIRAIAHPVFAASGELTEFVGTNIDVTERKRAEAERQAQLWFFESIDRINRAIQGTEDLEQMMDDVLDLVLVTFGCDRAYERRSLAYRRARASLCRRRLRSPNIAKHSHARSARTHVRGAADGVHLTVDDDGDGFDVRTLENRAGLGFVSMQERLRVLRGTFRVDSTPSRGTRIAVWIPSSGVVNALGAPEVRRRSN